MHRTRCNKRVTQPAGEYSSANLLQPAGEYSPANLLLLLTQPAGEYSSANLLLLLTRLGSTPRPICYYYFLLLPARRKMSLTWSRHPARGQGSHRPTLPAAACEESEAQVVVGRHCCIVFALTKDHLLLPLTGAHVVWVTGFGATCISFLATSRSSLRHLTTTGVPSIQDL